MADSKTSDPSSSSEAKGTRIPSGGKARVSSVVGLSLLEVIRALDLPSEVLAAEDPTQTMPRRLGLSDVVDQQIRLFKEQVRKGKGSRTSRPRTCFTWFSGGPTRRRPSSRPGICWRRIPSPPGASGAFPEKALYSLSRRQTRHRIKSLFGRAIGGFAHGSFTLEAQGHFLLDLDPGGDACALMTGLAQAVLSRTFAARWRSVTLPAKPGNRMSAGGWSLNPNSRLSARGSVPSLR